MQIIKTSITRPPRIVFYGEQGIGKSTIAAEAGAIFIQTSDGLEGLGVDAFPLAKTFQDVKDALNYLLTEKHNYKALAIDTLGGLERLIFAECCGELGLEFMTQSSMKSYPLAMKKVIALMQLINEINSKRKMFVFLIGHSQIARFEDPTTSSYDRYSLALNDKIGAYFLQECDIVGFINQKVAVKAESAGFSETIKASGVNRFAFFEKRPSFYAKDHDYGLPPEIKLEKGKAWEAIVTCIRAKITAQKAKPAPIEDDLPANFGGNLKDVSKEQKEKRLAKSADAARSDTVNS